MDWSDLLLRLIRAAGALTSALAGIAALLTDGAFIKRDPPLQGRWRDFPFAKYRVTRWGGTLLAVILIAPAVQFIGDWIKDANDAKSQQETAHNISSEIEHTVTSSTDTAQRDIVDIVRNESNLQLASVKTVIDEQRTLGGQTSTIATRANNILTDMDRSLHPFKDVTWAYEVQINLSHPKMSSFRDFLRQKAKEIFDRNQNLAKDLTPGTSVTAPTGYKSVYAFQRFGQRQRLLIGIDSPFLREADAAFGAILGYRVYVDVFRNPPAFNKLSNSHFRSPDYAVTLLPPYDADTYEMSKAANRFPTDSYRTFELIYIPANDSSPDSDQCFVDYYWHALQQFDILTERSETTIVGLPDFREALFVVRLDTVSDFWQGIPPYRLEALRMRVGSEELTLSGNDLGTPQSSGGYLIYRKAMPKNFDAVLRLFETVRSDQDKRPTNVAHLTDH